MCGYNSTLELLVMFGHIYYTGVHVHVCLVIYILMFYFLVTLGL